MPEAAPKCSACKRPATVYALDEGGAVPYCLEHGQVAGARRRCERCGLFKTAVERVLMLGHVVRPAKRVAGARTTGHMLCPDCVAAMEREQPDLFDEVGR